jgi:hypothetical protein
MGMEAQPMTAAKPYPLTFTPLVLEKVWGGRGLARLGRPLPSSVAGYGESWEIADLSATSVSGAGGGGLIGIGGEFAAGDAGLVGGKGGGHGHSPQKSLLKPHEQAAPGLPGTPHRASLAVRTSRENRAK